MPRILVADDNTNIQKMVTLALSERGIEVITVGNGEAAVRRLADVSPDLVLADVFMPVRNGYEVCEFVKKDERFAHVPVILLVGAFDPLDEKEARRVGADGVLKKPFVPPDPLIAMVTSTLEKNPKLAAELAKAREVVPEPPPAPAMEIPAHSEPKPLPHFPDPSPEEAALIYGFGSGKRGGDDQQGAGVAAQGAPPISQDESDEENTSATAGDWRRTSNDIEIPEEAGGSLAFSVDSDFDSAIFPSERDVPPKRVRVASALAPEAPAAADDSSSSFFVEKAEGHATAEPAAEATNVPEAAAPASPEHESEPKPELSFAETAAKWMDMMSPSTSEYPEGGWLGSSAPASEPPAAANIPAPEFASSHEAHEEATDAPAPQESAGSSFVTPAASADPVPAESWFAPPPVLSDHTVGAASNGNAAAPGSFSNELIAEPADTPAPLRQDPALVQPPAVRVTPEPLLVNEDAPAATEYGKPSEAISPLHSFLAPDESEARAAESGHGSNGFSERIPTAPPPNREALADIPFLTPPSSFSIPSAPLAVDAETVDAVVRRVLEKLEPQLHELLAEGMVKPLVENMLQGELTRRK